MTGRNDSLVLLCHPAMDCGVSVVDTEFRLIVTSLNHCCCCWCWSWQFVDLSIFGPSCPSRPSCHSSGPCFAAIQIPSDTTSCRSGFADVVDTNTIEWLAKHQVENYFFYSQLKEEVERMQVTLNTISTTGWPRRLRFLIFSKSSSSSFQCLSDVGCRMWSRVESSRVDDIYLYKEKEKRSGRTNVFFPSFWNIHHVSRSPTPVPMSWLDFLLFDLISFDYIHFLRLAYSSVLLN